jgi:GT2 family glycosyltransferase
VTVSVAAVVVANSADVYLSETLSQLSKQLYPIQQVIVVDTATSNETAQVVSRYGYSLIQPGDLRLGAAIQAGLQALDKKPQWLWILHDDSAPEPNALTQLAKTAEVSESVAVVGPKLLRWDLPIEIQQLGLTITPSGKPFLLVESEYDQGQFDVRSDTLAVSTAGMLVGFEVWEQLGGFDDKSPVLAQDIEFSLKARAAGFRVVVEPSAKVLHAGLAMTGQRSRRWLGGGYRTAIAKAHLHLFGLIAPRGVLPFLYLLLPLIAVLSIPYGLFIKRPGRISGAFTAWFWGWSTLPTRFGARRRIRQFGSIAAAKGLVASRKQIRQKQSKQMEFPPEQAKFGKKGFFSSGAFYLTLLLPLLALGSFPLAALSSVGSPIGRSFESVWAATAVDAVQYLDGVSFPADPFNWFYALIASVPTSPSLTLNWFVFLSSSLAFVAAWLLLGQFTQRPWLRNLAAISYALSPALLTLQGAAAVVELVVAIFTPLSVYFLLKTKSAFNSARSLRWGTLAGLSLALVGIANPVVFVLLGLTVLTLALANFGRAFALLISLLPGIALLAPWFFATSSTDLALFALTSSNRSELPDYLLWYVAVLGLLLVIAAALGRVLLALAVAVSSAILIGADRLLGFSFAEISSLLALGTVLLLVEVLQKIKKRQVKLAIAAGLSLGLAASGVVFGAMATRPLQVEDLSAPALVVAQADAEPSTRTLVISFEQAVNVDLVWGDGRSADERSVLYSALGAESSIKQPLAELTAQLVAANPAAVGTLLADLGIDFVLVVGSDPQALSTKAAVSGMEYFQIAGESSFGSLFRVTSERNEPVVEISAANRNWQLASFALFGLLLIPTPAVIRGYRRKAVK